MTKATLIFLTFLLLMSFDVTAELNHDKILIKSVESLFLIQENLDFQNSTDTNIYTDVTLKKNTFIYVTQIVFTFIILIFAFFVIILTPLILFYCWVSNYIDYRKYYILIYAIKNKSKKFPKHLISEYKQIFSSMFANGFGILAWFLSSYIYIFISYPRISSGLLDYLKFPFKLLFGITNENVSLKEAIPLNVWLSMLLIVVVSILHFFLGRFIGQTLINLNYKTFFSHIKKPEVIIN